jgi:hypothetical protein
MNKANNSQAINVMKRELAKLQAQEQECITEDGVVKTGCRYRYQMLVEQAAAFKRSIGWMEALYEGGVK